MSIYDHYRKEEHVFVDQVLSWKEQVIERYSIKLTDFLDLREQAILQSVIGNQADCHVAFYGGRLDSERKRAIIYPSYYTPEEEDYSLEAFELNYATKFHTLSHRQVLGTLMSLGITRGKFGDILIKNDKIQLIVAEEIASFVENNFNSVGKSPIKLMGISFKELIESDDNWQTSNGTVSSLRLDVLLSEFYNISRQKAQMLIKAGHVKVNQRIIDSTSFICEEGDLFSVKGFGRGMLQSIDGLSKKEKWRINYGVKK
ncbi:RNA-binding protein [Bacillus sp. AFS002410]|uniref:YlmH family RNA-binding protein n=1 Tax=Bacillus sp. AFS002410 TaxID=2033481 RepID=UPI000BF21991|nr:RNA-binding protein [Bacillus sp. AFS002410]PEJ60309.1 RNA-binding protein [Bacillus sp. AFS002410]